ncbi:MAG: hypothetical protein ACREAW_04715 [Nitrososphaera sp.]
MSQQSKIPANVVLYLRQEIARRTKYKIQKETKAQPPEFMEVEFYRHQMVIKKLDEDLNQLAVSIIKIAREYMADLELDGTDDELVIARILAALPAPEKVIVSKIFHGSHDQ